MQIPRRACGRAFPGRNSRALLSISASLEPEIAGDPWRAANICCCCTTTPRSCPDALEALVETADAHPETGAIGSQALFPDGRLQNAGGILWQDGHVSAPWAGERPAPAAFTRLRAVDFTGSCSLLVRAAAWDRIGGLDERLYPAYYVDADLAMSMRRIGSVVLYQPKSQVHHHQGASSSPRYRDFLSTRNRKLFLEKWAADLRQHGPFEANSPAAVERAMARAQALWQQRRTSRIATGPSARPRPFDSARQEREHYAKSLALEKEYLEHLGNLADAFERRLQELERAHKAVVRSRFWRMTAWLRYLARLFNLPMR